MTDLAEHSASQIARLIKTRDVSPTEVLEAHLEKIHKLNPQLNAIATLAPDVRKQANDAELAILRGETTGPLHGLPITIKDTIETAGLLSTSGSAMRDQFVPERDAPVVARLKAAGAIILAKTNAAEMAMEYTADNPVFGRTNNPYDISKSPGGSSGGDAVAVATCMSPGGIGSDLAGSVRIPAHFCGVVGLKPTAAAVPGAGQCPPAIGPYSLGAAIGPIARTVEDVGLLFSAMRNTGGDRRTELPRRTGVAWYTDDGVSPVSQETRAAVTLAVAALGDAGMITEEKRPPGIEHGNDLWLKLFSRASVIQLRKVYEGNEKSGGDFVRWRLSTADEFEIPTLDDYINAWMERDFLREQLVEWMNEFPILVAPVGATNALPHGAIKLDIDGVSLNAFKAFSYSQAFNVFDLPSVSVPVTQCQNGLPIGVQIVGRPFAEDEVLAAAAIIEKAFGGWRPPAIAHPT